MKLSQHLLVFAAMTFPPFLSRVGQNHNAHLKVSSGSVGFVLTGKIMFRATNELISTLF